jgi:hypothetical protein
VANGAATSCSKATTVMPSKGLIVPTFERHESLLLYYYTKRLRSIYTPPIPDCILCSLNEGVKGYVVIAVFVKGDPSR